MTSGAVRHSGGGASEGGRMVRCVLWMPRGGDAPEALIDELSRKGIEHEVTDHAYGALGKVCARVGARDEVRVLVLVEPQKLGWTGLMFRAFLGAMDRYAPEAARWVYQPRERVALRALTEGDVECVAGGVGAGSGVETGAHGAEAARDGARGGTTEGAKGSVGAPDMRTPRMERRPVVGSGVHGVERVGARALRLVDAPDGGGVVGEMVGAGGADTPHKSGMDELDGGDDVTTRAGQLTAEELAMLLGDDGATPLTPPGSDDESPKGGSGKGRGFRIFGRGGGNGGSKS